MYIETTGEIFIGTCDVKTSECVAKENGVVTKVLSPHESKTITVCNVCLNEMVKNRIWNIKGASVAEMKEKVDIAVLSDHTIQIAIEVKNWKQPGKEWAERMKDMAFDRMNKLHVPIFIVATYEGLYIFEEIIKDRFEQEYFIDLLSDIELSSKNLKFSYDNLFVNDPNEFRLDPNQVEIKHEKFVEILEDLLTKQNILNKLPKHISDLIKPLKIKKNYIFDQSVQNFMSVSVSS